jgi:hypothetical protein
MNKSNQNKKTYILSEHLMYRPFSDALKDFFTNSNDEEKTDE